MAHYSVLLLNVVLLIAVYSQPAEAVARLLPNDPDDPPVRRPVDPVDPPVKPLPPVDPPVKPVPPVDPPVLPGLPVDPVLPVEPVIPERPWIPYNGCYYNYGPRCLGNACSRAGRNCCYCLQCGTMSIFGLSQTCACCPRGYFCCSVSSLVGYDGAPTCCPIGTQCGQNYDCITSRPALRGSVLTDNCRFWLSTPLVEKELTLLTGDEEKLDPVLPAPA